MDRDGDPSAWIASHARRALFHTECPETTQFNALVTSHSGGDFCQNGLHDVIDITVIQLRILVGNFLKEFGFNHISFPGLPRRMLKKEWRRCSP